MSEKQHPSGAKDLSPSGFWDALAPHHSALENNYLDLPTIRRIMKDLQEPVLVVGGGQGLIVAEVRKNGLQCDGVDSSAEMIKYAKLRRGIALIKADAKALPIAEQTYGTVIYATGVIDFTEDEKEIQAMLLEGRRIVKKQGKIFIAFYRTSAALERFMTRVGLLENNQMAARQGFETYLMNPVQTMKWLAKRSGLSYLRVATLLIRMLALSTIREKTTTFRMQRLFRRMRDPNLLISTVPEKQPYRNEVEIVALFKRLAVAVKQLESFPSCYIVQIQ